MRGAFHITFFYSSHRMPYLATVLDEIARLPIETAVFVHSNRDMSSLLNRWPTARCITYGYRRIGRHFHAALWRHLFGKRAHAAWCHRLGLTWLLHPYYLAWENRWTIARVAEEFDFQVSLEDDVVFSAAALEYWLEHKDAALRQAYNLGFLRTENAHGATFVTDLTAPLRNTLETEGRTWLINDNNPYCAAWIMDRTELQRFMASPEWHFTAQGLDIREMAAIGWHAKGMTRYRSTLLPLVRDRDGSMQVDSRCALRHLPNNYAGHAQHCTQRFPLVLDDPAREGACIS